MTARKIHTSLPQPQYLALERVRKRLSLGRSAAVQQAVALWLDATQGDARVEAYVRGYMARPDDPREGRALVLAWARGLAKRGPVVRDSARRQRCEL